MLLQIEKDKAVDAYKKGDTKVKELLSNLFGTEVFQVITPETLNRFQEACKSSGFIPHDILHTDADLNIEQKVVNAYTMLRILAKAKRGDWEPDWNNSNEAKYYPYFKYSKDGFVVGDSRYTCSYASTGFGSRLCFQSSRDALDFGKENFELYKIILEN